MPFSGVVTRKRMFKRAVSGILAMTGSLGVGTMVRRALSGILALSGTLNTITFTHRFISGILSLTGELTSLHSRRLIRGVLSLRGTVARVLNGNPISRLFLKITQIFKITIG